MSLGIKVENLNVYYGKNHVLHDINMEINPMEVTALIGPSGCGKSTFIRSLNRMHEVVPDARVEGKIIVGGQNIYDSNVDPVEIRHKIGMVFQKPNPFPTMTIYDNVIAGLKLSGIRKKSILDEKVESSLKQAGLWEEVKDRLKTNAMGLSGGQQQRLCIARALAVEPEILLMDEPTSALDPISTSNIEDLMADLKKNYTVVIVTHNMQQAARISDVTAFFLSGVIVEMDNTQNIFTAPKDKRTEDYISGRFG